jgi:hypothetical protein
MSASLSSASTAAGLQLLADLATYEADVERLLKSRFLDADMYGAVGRMDDIRLQVSFFPSLSVPWVELVIRHFELIHGGWQVQQGLLDASELDPLHEAVTAAADRLRRQCQRVLTTGQAELRAA